MVHSSASDSSRRNSSEISWYYIQPGFKLIDAKKCAWAFAFFVFILFVISRFSHSLIFDSPWALLIVPGVAAFVIWLMLVMQLIDMFKDSTLDTIRAKWFANDITLVAQYAN